MKKHFLMIALAATMAGATPAAEPPALGTYQGAGCTGRDRLKAHETWLGRKVDVVLDGPAQDSWSAMRSSTKWIAQCWQNTGKAMVFSLPMLPKDGSSTLVAGGQGAYNAHVRQIAQTLVEHGHANATIRIGWEFNAAWFHWNSLKDPESWKAYWRQIVTTMRAVPGAQFQFDWCVIVHAGAPSPEAAYPGDDVVDTIGADVYNGNWNPSLSAEQRWGMVRNARFGLDWHRRFAAEHGKPMSFPEWGTGSRPDGHGGGDDPVFMRNMIQWIQSNPVKYHIYWDYKAPDYDGQLSSGKRPLAEAEFLRAFGVQR
ncbi:glycoside hydrolase family 26 protein [Pseudorhodoferax soli]|uniref:Glycosyl hydrolase family 26 n=1 Tax=Pseudorhodoferax soli TaxID=545864 RepID=A0A368YCX3_9BURK|nr:glycosyl hydrolase [Pseudorhodoferax soli]RCW76044.1 glycosyl hydrolase family 26 [Pseudorhodoferax soli]